MLHLVLSKAYTLIAENTGKHMEALNLVATLDSLDQMTAGELQVAMGIAEN